MSSRRAELNSLRMPLAALAAALSIAGAAIWFSISMRETRAREQVAAQARLSEARVRLANARQEEQDIASYSAAYKELIQRGVFGQERRLDWVEHINALRERKLLYSADYDISTQRPLELAAGLAANKVELLASRVQLNVSLLHEGDLLALLDDLAHSGTGFYRIESLLVRRLDASAAAGIAPNLAAEARMEWITMKTKDANQIQAAK